MLVLEEEAGHTVRAVGERLKCWRQSRARHRGDGQIDLSAAVEGMKDGVGVELAALGRREEGEALAPGDLQEDIVVVIKVERRARVPRGASAHKKLGDAPLAQPASFLAEELAPG